MTLIRVRGDTAANWTSANPVLAYKELAAELDTRRLKVGDGATAWNSLLYVTGTSVTGAALTKTDDTNVTLTLGGSPAVALLAATSITVNWSGQLSIARGGTGASTATAARTALGLAIGTDVQAFHANLSAIAGLTTAADRMIYWSGSGTAGLIAVPSAARTALATLSGTNTGDQASIVGITGTKAQFDAAITDGNIVYTDTLDTDTTLAANSDAKLATQKAVKAYVDQAVAGLLDFKGGQNCAANPNYPAGSKGDAYYISAAGKIGGASGKSVDIGDVVVASADNAGGTEASVGTSWFVLEHNLTGALVAANNLSDLTSSATARTNLGLGTLATQSGTFSGVSSGTNTGDQSSVSGNAGTATTLQTSRNIDGQAFNGGADITVIAPATHAATSKATPVDADELPLVDSAASNVLKKLTWANLKATLKAYFDTLYHSATPVAVRAYNSAAISISNATATVLTFDSERRDDGALHDTATNTDRLTAPSAGWYYIWGNVEYANNATGFRTTSIRLGAAAAIIGATQAAAVNGSETIMNTSCLYYLAAGDYVRLFVYQNSGGALNINGPSAGFTYSPEFGMARVG